MAPLLPSPTHVSTVTQDLPAIHRLTPLPSPSAKSPGRHHDGAVCILTGVSSPLGIGRATAHVLAAEGARALYLCDVSSRHMDSIRAEILQQYDGSQHSQNATQHSSQHNLDVHVRVFDAADESAVRDVVQDAVDRYDRLDVFFANAGVSGAVGTAITQLSEAEMLQTFRTNVLSVLFAFKHAAPAMKRNRHRRGGSLVATASVAGLRSNAGSSDYSASKAAVISLVRTASFQLAGTGVRVNAVLPGLIETGMTELMFEMARQRGTGKRVGQLNPTKRAGHADEVARVVAFLASDEASYVNGQAWAVDGGLSAGLPFVPGKLA